MRAAVRVHHQRRVELAPVEALGQRARAVDPEPQLPRAEVIPEHREQHRQHRLGQVVDNAEGERRLALPQ
jgi:hypothetical protein